ncbi:MAG: alpha/beta hydrolase [Pseudomonadales bacterium]|nr:alpha/beta hydrolase [Pseudomonadales bacterium]
MLDSKPFKRLPFVDIPAKPRIPHDFWQHPAKAVAMDSSVFGPLSINCHVRGTGKPLILLHGLMTTSYSFRYLAPFLEDHFSLYIPDLPGAGRSSMPQKPEYLLTSFAQWLVEFQQTMGIAGCACVGNSMGALIAMHAALNTPGCFSHLVNIHSPVFPMLRLHALRAALSLPGSAEFLHRIINMNPLKWAYRNIHYFDESLKSLEEAHEYGDPLTSREGSMALFKFLHETLNPVQLQAFIDQLVALKESGRAFPVPLTLLYARQDPMVPPSVGTRLADLVPTAKMIWMENTSHFAHVDTPEAVSKLVIAALE